MIRLGTTGSVPHLDLCRALEIVFQRRGIEFDWVLYSGYDQMVDGFVRGEIDVAWNGPLSHVKMRRAIPEGTPVIVMRDVDFDFTTNFVVRTDSSINSVEDLPGSRFAFGARNSVQAGLLPVYFLKQLGINPTGDLAVADFFDQREPLRNSDELDVVVRVLSGEYDSGAVSGRVLATLPSTDGIDASELRVMWTSPTYNHCCFTARPDLAASDASDFTSALVSVDDKDEIGRAVLRAEQCERLVPGVDDGWDLIEAAALAEGLI